MPKLIRPLTGPFIGTINGPPVLENKVTADTITGRCATSENICDDALTAPSV